MQNVAIGKTIHRHVCSAISSNGNTRFLYTLFTVSLLVLYVTAFSSRYKAPPIMPLRHRLHMNVFSYRSSPTSFGFW